jgi:AbrB family looped-hinge helix DNA binding protein
MVRAVVRARGQITLPREVREALHVDEGDDIAFVVEGGHVTMRGLKSIPADQAWFWSDDWQAGEREASGQLARAEGSVFEDGPAFLDSLA